MKKTMSFIIFIIASVILVPVAVVFSLGGPPVKPPAATSGESVAIRIYMKPENRIVEMNLEEYLKGVVAAEMPAEFELEALKAQAVAARTYAVKNMVSFGGAGLAEYPGADVSSDPKVSQAWESKAELQKRWGSNYEQYWSKVSRAVEETHGLIAVYNGEPISAVFHSTSGERTASAKEVWGFDYPYLQSVVCTWDKKSPRYSESKGYSLAELEKRLGPEVGVVAAAQSGNGSIMQTLGYTQSGRVDKIRLGSKTFSGVELRQKLELRSTNFTVNFKGDEAVFNTVGYGHGVGLCQYGANGMAQEGFDFRYILKYYYKGIELKNILGS